MAVTATPVRNSVFLRLNFGTSPTSGARIIKSISLGPLKTSTFDATDFTKVYAIVNALSPCLDRAVYEVQHFALNLVDSDD